MWVTEITNWVTEITNLHPMASVGLRFYPPIPPLLPLVACAWGGEKTSLTFNLPIWVKGGNMNKQSRIHAGFTLIEVLIVVAIIGILAAIAVPNYSRYVQRGKLTEATAGLADFRTKLEQDYLDNRTYGGVGVDCKKTYPPAKHFTFACKVDGASESKFIATATNIAGVGLGSAGDFEYTINESNAKGTTKAYGVTPTVGVGCWALVKGESC